MALVYTRDGLSQKPGTLPHAQIVVPRSAAVQQGMLETSLCHVRISSKYETTRTGLHLMIVSEKQKPLACYCSTDLGLAALEADHWSLISSGLMKVVWVDMSRFV